MNDGKEKKAEFLLEQFQISDLIESKAEYNPRSIDSANKYALNKSIEKYGYLQPLIFNKKTSRLVSGHQRLDILQSQGYESADVVVVDLEEEEEVKLNILLNSKTLQGEFTSDVNALLKKIRDDDVELYDIANLHKIESIEKILDDMPLDGSAKHDQSEDKEMMLLPYESYDCILVVCKKRDDFMYLSSKLGLDNKVIISSPVVKNKSIGNSRCIDASVLMEHMI